MIRRRDQVRLSVQKLFLRKKRAIFSVISIALGVVVVVVVNALARGVRDMALRTNLTDDIDPGVVRVYASNSPYEYYGRDEEDEKPRPIRYMTEAIFEQWRTWPAVAAASQPATADQVGFSALTNLPRSVTELTGVPEPLLRRYVSDPQLLADCTNAIPLVIGERYARLAYNTEKHQFEMVSDRQAADWLGRTMILRVGDVYAGLRLYHRDYETKQWELISETDQKRERQMIASRLQGVFDLTLYHTVLTLRGRVVGFCPGARVLAPIETVARCEDWLDQRNELARLEPRPPVREEFGPRGRLTTRTNEYGAGLVVVRDGEDVEAVAAKIRAEGFTATTRNSATNSFLKEFDSGMRIVKRIAYAIGGVILLIAAALLWSTTSRIVSDSRADIGLFRALGATRRDIRRLFLTETVLLGLLGTLTGLIGGWTAAHYISRWGLRLVRDELSDPEDILTLPETLLTIDLKFAVQLLLAAAILAWLAGFWPARRAANIDPVKALKRE